jgi:hypothetical protein
MAQVEVKDVLRQDIDDVLAFARDLTSRDRNRLLGAATHVLQQEDDDSLRLKAMMLIQALLSQGQNGRLATANALGRTLSSIASDVRTHLDIRLAAINGLMLMLIKARSTAELAKAAHGVVKLARKDDEPRIRREAEKLERILQGHRHEDPKRVSRGATNAVTPLDEDWSLLVPRLLAFTLYILAKWQKAHQPRSRITYEKRASDYVQEAVVLLIERRGSISASNVFGQLCRTIERLVEEDYASSDTAKSRTSAKAKTREWRIAYGKTGIVLDYLPDVDEQIYTRDRVRGYIDALSPRARRDAWRRLAGESSRGEKLQRSAHRAPAHR